MPHWQQAGATYFITFRLRAGELSPEERAVVLDACLFWHEKKWTMEAVVVMPDHVHILARPLPSVDAGIRNARTGKADASDVCQYYALSKILHSTKSYTAHQIARRRSKGGVLWVEESFDRIVRNPSEFREKLEYMAKNPVKAGLCSDYREYPYFWCRTR